MIGYLEMESRACPLGQRMPSTCAWHPLFECNMPLSSTRQSRLNSISNRRCRAAKSPLKAQDWQLGVCKIESLRYEHGTTAAYILRGTISTASSAHVGFFWLHAGMDYCTRQLGLIDTGMLRYAFSGASEA
jgi:hypothetical protein